MNIIILKLLICTSKKKELGKTEDFTMPLFLFVPSRPFQPSVYLRLLENPPTVAPQASLLFKAESRRAPPPSPSRSESCDRSPSSGLPPQPPPEHHSSSMGPSSDGPMQQVILVTPPTPHLDLVHSMCGCSRFVPGSVSISRPLPVGAEAALKRILPEECKGEGRPPLLQVCWFHHVSPALL